MLWESTIFDRSVTSHLLIVDGMGGLRPRSKDFSVLHVDRRSRNRSRGSSRRRGRAWGSTRPPPSSTTPRTGGTAGRPRPHGEEIMAGSRLRGTITSTALLAAGAGMLLLTPPSIAGAEDDVVGAAAASR